MVRENEHGLETVKHNNFALLLLFVLINDSLFHFFKSSKEVSSPCVTRFEAAKVSK